MTEKELCPKDTPIQAFTNSVIESKAVVASEKVDNQQVVDDQLKQKSMESQLKHAMILASTRSALLLDTENRLAIAQGKVKALERDLETEKAARIDKNSVGVGSPRKDDNILSITISSLQNLLLEKDASLTRYQELLREERLSIAGSYDSYRSELKEMQNNLNVLEVQNKLKDRDLEILREKLEKLNDHSEQSRMEVMMQSSASSRGTTVIIKPSFEEEYVGQLPDKFIEDMFMDDRSVFDVVVDDEASSNELEAMETIRNINKLKEENTRLQAKLRNVSNRETVWEKNLNDKDKEINVLTEK